MSDSRDLKSLLAAAREGDRGASDRIFSLVYDDLRRIAHHQISAGPAHATLNTTVLVHEVYLKLVDRSALAPESRSHFFAVAARAMRQIAVDYARRCRALKRGGDEPALALDPTLYPEGRPELGVEKDALEILALEDALTRLSEADPRLGQVVELRFYGGFSEGEIAGALGVSTRTVKRLWRVARMMLQRDLSGLAGSAAGPGQGPDSGETEGESAGKISRETSAPPGARDEAERWIAPNVNHD